MCKKNSEFFGGAGEIALFDLWNVEDSEGVLFTL